METNKIQNDNKINCEYIKTKDTDFLGHKRNLEKNQKKVYTKITINEEKQKKFNLIFEKNKEIIPTVEITKKLAFDCEMVEINKLGSGLAKISVVNEHGDTIINSFCKPPGEVTDYRYEITGLTPSDLENAKEYNELRKTILKLFKNKILIGHSLENDLMALDYEHPKNLTRDTSKFKFFRNNYNQPHSLKYLSDIYLNKIIQTDSHDPIEDARATLCLYKLYEDEIEKDIMNKNHKMIRKKVAEDAKKLHNLFGI
jgi:RNA exonuclease 4